MSAPCRTLLLAFAAIVLVAAGGNAQGPVQEPGVPKAGSTRDTTAAPTADFRIEPKAVELLKASSQRLAAARTMRFTALVSYESPSRLGPPLLYATRSEVTLQRPDKLRVVTPGDGPASEFYYNGKTMVAFAPAEKLIATADAPATIDAALEAAYRLAAIYYPFSDLIFADPYKHIEEGLTLAFYVGQSRVVGGITTDIVVYETHGAFVQIWIGAEDKLPRLARAVYRNDPAQYRHALVLQDWQLDGLIPADTFAPKEADKATPMPFARPDANVSRGGKPAPGVIPPAAK
jgi:hypothetical protein